MDTEVLCVHLCVSTRKFRRLVEVMKKIITLLIGCAMLSAVFLGGCAEENTTESENNSSTVSQTTSGVSVENEKTSENEENITSEESRVETNSDTTDSVSSESSQNEEGEVIVDDTAHETYEFVDETVTNPTVSSYETENSESRTTSEVTVESLKGSWKPLIVTSVADGEELDFNQAFGSAYSQYGGFLEISNEGSFILSMGASVKEANSKGTFTLSENNLIVTYSDGSPDTFLYIPQYQNHQVIKTQIGSFYVYFYKA